ncbi:MAG: oligoendopeptidase F, partial [Planctomycetes bacterium]|nr:oligoendopeptidase F [Planctomycetota bacterium]
MTRSIKFFRRVTFALWPVLLLPGLVPAQEQKEVPERSTLAPEHTWNLSGMFSSRGTWESELKAVERAIKEVERLKEVAGVSASALEETLGLYERAAARVDRVMLYASLRHDLDTRDDAARADENRAQLLGTRFAEATSWMEPAILAIPPETLDAWTKNFGNLKQFGHFIDDIVRKRAHVLDKEGEALLASARELARAPETIYSTLTNAELLFPTIRDERGDEVTLSPSRYSKFMRSADRRVRRDAFKGTLQAYLKYKNTCAATLSAQVQRDIFLAKARNYKTSLEASLAVDNIPSAVYHNLIKTINANLHHMHRYARLRKRVLKLDELHVYDL